MRIKKKYLQIEFLIFGSILSLIFLKLIFSYLIVEPSYWIRHLSTNYEKYNLFKLPKNISTYLEYLIIPLMGISILYNYKFLGKQKITLYLTFCLFFLNILTSFYNNITILDSINHTLKLVSPIYLFIILVTFYYKHGGNLKPIMFNMIKLVFFLIIIGLLFLDISMNRKEVKWPIYFANIHTHSYILASTFIGISYIYYYKRQSIKLFTFLFISFIVLYYGYGVRTVLILYLTYIIVITFLSSDFFKYVWLQAVFIIPLFILGFIFISQSLNLNKYSSGRLDMYNEKLEVLKDYNLTEYLIGKGYESDLMKTDTWWWEEKGSHSDFITYFVENGLIYLLVFVLLILSLSPNRQSINAVFFSLIVGYFMSSLISNGIADRPIAGYVFFTVLAFIYCQIVQQKLIKDSC
jgi:hypothetical protein